MVANVCSMNGLVTNVGESGAVPEGDVQPAGAPPREQPATTKETNHVAPDDNNEPHPSSTQDKPNTTPEKSVPSGPKPKGGRFEFGPYVPINKTGDKIIICTQGVVSDYYKCNRSTYSSRLVGEILPSDSIIEAPSLVNPLILKKKTTWPPRQDPSTDPSDRPAELNNSDLATANGDEEIQVLKVVGRSDTPDILYQESSRHRKPEEYIKATVVASLTNNSRSRPEANQTKSILALKDYALSAPGQFLFELGLSRVMEHNLEDRVKRLSYKSSRGDSQSVLDLANAKMELVHARQCNSRYKPKSLFRCHLCAFNSEFASVLEQHLNIPHKGSMKYYLCNWCDFKAKDSTQILYHNQKIHHKFRVRLEQPPAIHCCRYCPFESNSKRKFTSHITKCEQSFDKHFNLAPDDPDDYPAVTSKPITQQDVRVYESTLKALRLAAYNPHQIKVSSPALGLNGYPILLLPKSVANNINIHQQQPQVNLPVSEAAAPYNHPSAIIGRGSAGKATDLTAAMDQQSASPNLLRLLVANGSVEGLPKNRNALLQNSMAQSTFSNGMSLVKHTQTVVMAPPPAQQQPSSTGQIPVIAIDSPEAAESGDKNKDRTPSPKASSNSNGTFVICEICDAYIENVKSFKSHMQWVHRVKIHQKVLDQQKPPLNCQKCNWRFFTDQGLERHLLGSHGLVTSNMQELADKEKDSGRCTICGSRFPKGLVAHMREVHKINLKSAQLTYKCIVCSATFSLYRPFENHVYRVHGNARQATDK